jgi:hypothetical protein
VTKLNLAWIYPSTTTSVTFLENMNEKKKKGHPEDFVDGKKEEKVLLRGINKL